MLSARSTSAPDAPGSHARHRCVSAPSHLHLRGPASRPVNTPVTRASPTIATAAAPTKKINAETRWKSVTRAAGCASPALPGRTQMNNTSGRQESAPASCGLPFYYWIGLTTSSFLLLPFLSFFLSALLSLLNLKIFKLP